MTMPSMYFIRFFIVAFLLNIFLPNAEINGGPRLGSALLSTVGGFLLCNAILDQDIEIEKIAHVKSA